MHVTEELIHKLPKAELHCHLDGSLRISTILDLAENQGVSLPSHNEKDLAEIPDNVKKNLNIIPVETVDDVMKHALVRPLVAIEWDEDEQEGKSVSGSSDDTADTDGLVTH